MKQAVSTAGFLGAFLLLLIPAAAIAQAPTLVVSSVEVATPNIIIRGEGLLDASNRPSPTQVLLGDSLVPLQIVASSSTRIDATLPAVLAAGSYLLTVGYGLNNRQFDQAWLTIGAAGPQGIQGPPGPQGERGEPGPSGPPGPASAQCFEGDAVECYTGTQSTRGIGLCRPGKRTCTANGTWGSCAGQMVPAPEVLNGLDDNCDGSIDEGVTPLEALGLSNFTLTEGQSTTKYISLSGAPAGTVVLTILSQNPQIVAVNPNSLTFTAADFNVMRPVTFTAVQDPDSSDHFLDVLVSGNAVIPRAVSVLVLDDDRPEVLATAAEISVPEGGVGTFGVRLESAPAGNVLVSVQVPDSRVVQVAPINLQFTPTNYNVFQTITVSGMEDANNVGEVIVLRFYANGGLTSRTVTVTTVDND